MINFKKWISPLCLIFSLVFAVSSLYAPWWGIWNSKADEVATNNTKIVYYMPLQTIIASDAKANISITISFNDIAENDTNKSTLSSFFATTLDLSVVGIVLTIVTLALTMITVLMKRTFEYTWLIGIIGAILLFLALFYIAIWITPTFMKFANIMPAEIGTISGTQITLFWGSAGTWVWGAGYGWLLLLTSALLGGIGSMLGRQIQKRAE